MTIEDNISRLIVQEEISKSIALKENPHQMYERIQAIPSVTPQQAKWIPVSERLPEDNIHVLCQFYLGGMGECYLAHGVFHIVGGLVMTCNEIIAWMPLPQPYKAESEDKK